VLWHGFDDQSWVVLALAPVPAAAIGTIALPRCILGGRMSHPQCVGLLREVVLWQGFDSSELGGAGFSASARRCDWDNRPPEAYFGRADVPFAVRCVGLAREVVSWHRFDD
jgi:hypothetical protein